MSGLTSPIYVMANGIQQVDEWYLKKPDKHYIIKIQGAAFICECGSISFYRPDWNDRLLYRCFECNKLYEVT